MIIKIEGIAHNGWGDRKQGRHRSGRRTSETGPVCTTAVPWAFRYALRLGGALVSIAAFLLTARVAVAAPQEGATIYLPLVVNQQSPHDADDPPVVGTLKGCAGCTITESQQINAAWSYVWHPRPEAGQLPLIKPDYHQAREAASSAEQVGWLLWANEPDLEGPAPEQAAALYPQAEELGVKLVLATGSQVDENQQWAQAFRSAYIDQYGRAPRIDALAAHCYYDPSSVDLCIAHVQRVVSLARSWGVDGVWVTEFACLPGIRYSMEQCFDASSNFIAWMEGEATVNRYALFGARIDPQEPWNVGSMYNSLFWWNEPHSLTEWGRWYRSVP